ncbi:heavy metal translocating P-type ATPase [Bordetella pseudohinzii]|uniref:Copper-exporting P-type ATPase A n=1 Tax=Bordetella pseudohinzii TaxID=1331258 RepID=A0A0J6BWX7_9BORD|nr:cation-translocating P-type ATPase [Bordetella pseudohinzii]ANY15162.1 metal transporter [Bordetella pseudohinzii]KMM26209.1 metal transporter [Bordetella pseudohinzii]KXA75673.1 metal transporter [Bordetella pseudohinzii]KXA76164.1 metal transporter [Bordetella pseudohinzii]CUI51340.1 Copper-exporting P-type ATPase A [Bordetella pseudohinzii]
MMDMEPARRAGRMVFAVEGLWCASCAMALQRALARLPGITSASVNFTSGSALLTWTPETVDFEQVFERARKLGYGLAPLQAADARALPRQARRIRLQLVVAVVFGMWSMLGSWVLYLDEGRLDPGAALAIAWATLLAGLPVVGYAGLDFYRAAWRTLRAGLAGMDTLITLGVAGSLLVSLWELAHGQTRIYIDAATMLIAFLLAGRLIEVHARQESRLAVDALKQLAPETATRLEAGQPTPRRLDDIAAGDTVLVRANERVPVDGIVLQGESALDRSLLSGESLPAPVGEGQTVLAGSVNLQGALTLRVTAAAGQRRIDFLGLRMLELFGARSSLSETAERFVRLLLPAVLLVALAAFGRYLWAGQAMDLALIKALGILVAACPCAVGLATPLAYTLACRKAAASDILFRDPASVEALARARVYAFDKTGTLTLGELALTGIRTAAGWSEAQVLGLALEAESVVSHPIASALRRAAQERQLPGTAGATAHRAHARGVSMQAADGALIQAGAHDWLAGAASLPPDTAGSMHVVRNGVWIGSLRFQDRPRPEARATLAALAAQGRQRWLLTGDSAAATAQLLAALETDFDLVRSALSPEDKAACIRGASAVFVGDGANDGLVLASAACGVAIPGASSVAVAAAGVVITRGGISRLLQAQAIARRMLAIARQNLLFSMAYNVAVVAVFFGTGATPFAAALAMLASSLTVFANTARIGLPGRAENA